MLENVEANLKQKGFVFVWFPSKSTLVEVEKKTQIKNIKTTMCILCAAGIWFLFQCVYAERYRCFVVLWYRSAHTPTNTDLILGLFLRMESHMKATVLASSWVCVVPGRLNWKWKGTRYLNVRQTEHRWVNSGVLWPHCSKLSFDSWVSSPFISFVTSVCVIKLSALTTKESAIFGQRTIFKVKFRGYWEDFDITHIFWKPSRSASVSLYFLFKTHQVERLFLCSNPFPLEFL